MAITATTMGPCSWPDRQERASSTRGIERPPFACKNRRTVSILCNLFFRNWFDLRSTLMAIPVMRYLAGRKIGLAKQLGSRALRADAMESVTCGWLFVVAVVSLGVQAVSRVWWIDSVGSPAIVWLLVKEGREAWRGKCCADC
jgi:hypothetical protein